MVIRVVEFLKGGGVGGTKLDFFLLNQHTQRKLLNIGNWCNGEVSKRALTRLTWLIHTSVLPSNWNLGKNFALTC